jgi:hypothetical protein
VYVCKHLHCHRNLKSHEENFSFANQHQNLVSEIVLSPGNTYSNVSSGSIRGEAGAQSAPALASSTLLTRPTPLLTSAIQPTSSLNVMVQCVALLLHIREGLGSNLNLKAGYPDAGILWFSSVPPGKFWDSNSK